MSFSLTDSDYSVGLVSWRSVKTTAGTLNLLFLRSHVIDGGRASYLETRTRTLGHDGSEVRRTLDREVSREIFVFLRNVLVSL